MDWHPLEVTKVGSLVTSMEAASLPRCSSYEAGELIALDALDVPVLKDNLADLDGGAVIVRQLLRGLCFDENSPFRHGLDNKLVQALLLQHYCPGTIPITIGLQTALDGLPLGRCDDTIRSFYRNMFFVKPCFGSANGVAFIDAEPSTIDLFGNETPIVATRDLYHERFLIQQKLTLAQEYRVHSMEDTVLTDLTYLRHSPSNTRFSDIHGPNSFIQDIIDSLPGAVLLHSLYAWDVGIDSSGRPFVLEVNVTGNHRSFRPGFQCSGFFQTRAWRILNLAKLIHWIDSLYGVKTTICVGEITDDQFTLTYWLLAQYLSYSMRLNSLGNVTGLVPGVYSLSPGSNRLSLTENAVLLMISDLAQVEEQAVERAVNLEENHNHSATATRQNASHKSPSLSQQPFGLANRNADSASATSSRERENRFFNNLLRGVDSPIQLYPSNNPDGGHAFEEHTTTLDSAQIGQLHQSASQLSVSVKTLVHLAWALVINRLTGAEDLVFGTVLYEAYQNPWLHSVVPFKNMLPVRICLADASLKNSAIRLHHGLAELHSYCRASLSAVHRSSPLRGDLPLFDSAVDYRQCDLRSSSPCEPLNNTHAQYNVKSLHLTPSDWRLSVLSVDHSGEQMVFRLRIYSALGAARITQFVISALQQIVGMCSRDSDCPISQLDCLPLSERTALLHWNNTHKSFPVESSITELFERQAAEAPMAIALEFNSITYTYKALLDRVKQLSQLLLHRGCGRDSRVAICIDRSPDMLISVLAVLKVGAAYVPIDPSYPQERIRHMLHDSGAVFTLTHKFLSECLLPIAASSTIVSLDDLDLTCTINTTNTLDGLRCVSYADSFAYIIYTSGSSGVPKGVQVTHRSLTNLIYAMQDCLDLKRADRFLAHTTISFDISIIELLFPLAHGGHVVLLTDSAARDSACVLQAIRSGVKFVQATPTIWKMIVAAGWEERHHLVALSGGEKLPADVASSLVERCDKVWNLYGPTETTVWSVVHCVNQSSGPISIGRPIANTKLYIVDKHLRLVPIGTSGELCIGGVGVATGYRNRPELTANCFITNPFEIDDTTRLYRTGDIVKYQSDGTVLYLGRNDSQVKISGIRIELGEIEAHLCDIKGIDAAIAVPIKGLRGEDQIVVYYTVSADAEGTVSSISMQEHLSRVLPRYMLPAQYRLIGELPRTPNGKLDRQTLERLTWKPELSDTSECTITETKVMELWRSVFGIENVKFDDNFLSLGGHSMLAVKLMNQLRSQFAVELELSWFFEPEATVRELAAMIDESYTSAHN